MNETSWDVIVIGGGAAGLSAALMLGRARRRTLVIDAGSPRNRFAAHMHGVLGHEGAPPADLLALGRDEVATYGVRVVQGTADRVTRTEHGVEVRLGAGTHSARALIVATGMSDELPAIPGLAERWGTSVLHCPYCHGWEVRDQRLGVLTTSPIGLHQAQLIRQWSDRVTVFTHGAGPVDPETGRRLRSRGIELVADRVEEVLGDGDRLGGVRLEGGGTVLLDALFTAGTPRPHDEMLASLRLERSETQVGSFLAVDPTGRTSDERIWAVGNVVNPAATVPMAIGAAASTAGAVNMALVTEDFDVAGFWEDRYGQSDRIWSGRPNRVLVAEASRLGPGRALDLGCGEGADAIWLAERGWDVTGIDISATAVERARSAARGRDVDGAGLRLLVADLAGLGASEPYDLVTASFLQSPVPLARTEILRRAAELVAPGGHLLVTSHASPPPWTEDGHGHTHRFPGPEEELAALALDADEWETLVCERRSRSVTDPDGRPAELEDTVVLVRRR